jgi:hypothetical protein
MLEELHLFFQRGCENDSLRRLSRPLCNESELPKDSILRSFTCSSSGSPANVGGEPFEY